MTKRKKRTTAERTTSTTWPEFDFAELKGWADNELAAVGQFPDISDGVQFPDIEIEWPDISDVMQWPDIEIEWPELGDVVPEQGIEQGEP